MCTDSDRYQAEITDKKSRCIVRKKLWQLDSPLHCSVIGTCLSLGELRRLCRKMQINVQATLTDYELHRSFVGIAGKQTYASRCLHKYLDQKYRITLSRFAKVRNDAALETLWEEAVKSGDLAGAYWALATHSHASPELTDRVYGEIHMLSHLAGAAVRVDMQELTRLRHLTGTLTKQLADTESKARTQIKEKDTAISEIKERLMRAQAAESELDDARQRLLTMENKPFLLRLRKQLEEYAAKLAAEQARTERAEASAEEWKRMAMKSADLHLNLKMKMTQLQAERDTLEATLEHLLAPNRNDCSSHEGCLGNINLCGRCIVYVGGRSRQCAHFRALVERQNGQFIHHDGGLHDGRLRLSSILPQADVVLCPLDCVSHDAAHQVKQFCKRHGKRLVLLPRSSLAAFTRGLNGLAA